MKLFAGILGAQGGVERRIARRRVGPVDLERSIDEQAAVRAEAARRAGEQVLADPPGRNVENVDGDDRDSTIERARRIPARVEKVDAQR